MDSKVIYDALSITSKIHSTQDLIELLGLTGVTWEVVKGHHGYRQRLYWNSISIHFDGREDDVCSMGIWLEMMGQGCRAFETYGSGCYEDLFNEVLCNPDQMNITRLDVAFDDHEGILDIEQLCDDTRSLEFVSRFNEWQVILGSKGSSVTHGSMKSDIFVRIYDKALERGYTDGRHWIRVELQLRRERALAFINQHGSVGERFSGVLLNYLRYVDEDLHDSNRWRWDLKPYWDDLIGGALKIRLYEKPGEEYNILNLQHYVYDMAGGAAWTLMQIEGKDKFLDMISSEPSNLNPKYKRILEMYGRKEESQNPDTTQQNKNSKLVPEPESYITLPTEFFGSAGSDPELK